VVIGLIFVVSLFASNRIAGPMYAFDKVLKQIHGGDLTARLHLRPGDICHNVADEMNATFDDLQNRITAMKDTVSRLQQLENISSEQQVLIDELQAQLDHFSKLQDKGE
jgi:methyl-accepting chemotaxis protein